LEPLNGTTMTPGQDRFEEELTALSPERTNLLPALHLAQETFGYLPDWAMERVGRRIHVPASEVHGVASGYTEFRFEPPPDGLVQICTGLSCRLAGANVLLSQAQSAQPDAVERVSCLFLCSLAPVVISQGRMAGRVDFERLTQLQQEVRSHAG
jgi:formate dehydrogenase subunit gamma